MRHSQGRGGDADAEEVLRADVVFDCRVDHASVVVEEEEVLDVVITTLENNSFF